MSTDERAMCPSREIMNGSTQPQDEAAQDFMNRKGLSELPVHIEELRSKRRWRYSYVLDAGGELDLVVEWIESEQDWDVWVIDFRKS